MLESFRNVAPFCDRITPPPPALPLLTTQTDLFFSVLRPARLLVEEQLPLNCPTTPKQHNHTPKPPYTKPEKYTARFQNKATSPEHDKVASERDDDPPSDGAGDFTPEPDSDDGDRISIPKPPGEAGRPHSGGYSLNKALSWPKLQFDELQVRSRLPSCPPSLINFSEVRSCSG
jgi:hypothetical protein